MINIAICGAKGYAGQALLQLVLQHPQLKLGGLLVKKSTKPDFDFPDDVPCFSVDEVSQYADIDLLFLATPPEVSIEMVVELKKLPLKIIDLSGAFRLPQAQFEKTYGFNHALPDLLPAHYGLSPWLPPKAETSLVANPGCYATCVLMALIPLIKEKIAKPNNIIVDAKSGVSGAGKKLNADLMFCEMDHNFFPYKINQHRHQPEMLNALSSLCEGVACDLRFVPQVLPMVRGMSAAIYLDSDPACTERSVLLKNIDMAYKNAYQNYPLVKFAQINNGDDARDKWLLSLKSVARTPKVHIGYDVDQQGRLFVFSAIDNLLKGAASQAIENLNALYGFPITMGLL